MNNEHIKDRISWAYNIAARAVGHPADAFRPRGPHAPLSPSNRYLRLHAAFSTTSGNFSRSQVYGSGLYTGYFDTAYTKVGDYLVQGHRVFFIAEQDDLLPTLCVRTNSTVSVRRPSLPATIGMSGYGGGQSEDTSLLIAWPASALGIGGGGPSRSGLPGEGAVPGWSVLLPAPTGINLTASDIVSDDQGRQGIITAAELTHMGWRLTIKQASA
jgi:hypothetical protein